MNIPRCCIVPWAFKTTHTNKIIKIKQMHQILCNDYTMYQIWYWDTWYMGFSPRVLICKGYFKRCSTLEFTYIIKILWNSLRDILQPSINSSIYLLDRIVFNWGQLIEKINWLNNDYFFILTSCETYNSAYKMHE